MESPNVVLIVIDTVRKDIMQLYGGPAKTPFFNKFAEEAVVYDNAIAPSPSSAPAHASLLSGLYPKEHGMHENGNLKIASIENKYREIRSVVLPEYLKGLGYNTVAISNNAWVSELFGFDRGFNTFLFLDVYPPGLMRRIGDAEHYGTNRKQIFLNLLSKGKIGTILDFYKIIKKKEEIDNAMNYPVNKGVDMTSNLVSNLNLSNDNKFFLFVNLVEAHEPYKNEGLDERWEVMLGLRQQSTRRALEIKKEYINEVEYLDKALERIMASLKDRGVYDESMIIILSDHGQAFSEHGFMYHGIYLYDEIVRVPLMIKYPKGRKFNKKEGYQSLTRIYQLIKDIINGGDDGSLTSDVVLAQSFGFSHEVPIRYKNRISEINPQFYKLREAVFKGNAKITFNVTDNKIEELLKGNEKLDENANKESSQEMLTHAQMLYG